MGLASGEFLRGTHLANTPSTQTPQAARPRRSHIWARESDEHYVEPSWCSAREQCFVESPRRAVIDVLDDVSQPSRPQSDLEAPGAAVADFAIEQQCQPFGVREIAGLMAHLRKINTL